MRFLQNDYFKQRENWEEVLYPGVQYVNRLMTHSRGQKVIRFYDLDDNLIEVGTPVHGDKC